MDLKVINGIDGKDFNVNTVLQFSSVPYNEIHLSFHIPITFVVIARNKR